METTRLLPPSLSLDEFPSSFVSSITGSRGSGKTTVCESLLNRFMDGPKSKRRFDTIFLFSATMSPANFEGIPNNYKFVDLEFLPEIIKRQANVTQHNKLLKIKRQKGTSTDAYVKSSICIVLDDMLATGSLRNNKLLNSLCMNGRHVNAADPQKSNELCTFILSQVVNGMDPKIRRNTDVAFCNRISSRTDRKTFIESGMCCDSSRQGLTAAYNCYDACTTFQPYAFCVLLNAHPNKICFNDFVRTYVADIPNKKVKRLFGFDEDFATSLKRVDITS